MLTLLACQQQSKTKSFLSSVERLDTLKTAKLDSTLAAFSNRWKQDSLGNTGYRLAHYSFNANTKSWLINGRTFNGYSKKEIIDILGQPTSSGLGREDSLLIMTYLVRRGKNLPDKTLILYFDKDNRLSDIIEETGMDK
jgi:hypothetical protein